MPTITFTVPGPPVGQPRAKATTFGGHTRLYTPTKTSTGKSNGAAEQKAAIRLAFGQAYDGPQLTGPIKLELTFVAERPTNKVWKRRPMPRDWDTRKPDADNAIKLAQDALNGTAWRDDAQVACVTANKFICGADEMPHTVVTIETLSH